MKNNRLLAALRYVGDPSRDGVAQYLISTVSAKEIMQAYDAFVTTLEDSYNGQRPMYRVLAELGHARVELQTLQQTDFFKAKKNKTWCECIEKSLLLIEEHQRIAYTVSLFGTAGNGDNLPRSGHLRWAGSHNDLVELVLALQAQGAVVDATGQKAGYAPLLRLLSDTFRIRVDNIYVKKAFVLDRTTENALFLRKLLAAFDRTVEEHLK